MKLIVGLGNPGSKYALTRHNAGFMAVDFLARKQKATFKKKMLLRCWLAECTIAGEKIVLAKPTTYMNLSGRSVKSLIKKFKLEPKDLLVSVDDKDLKLGELRLRPKGSSGGHKGLKSIMESVQTDDFPRIRIGVYGETEETNTADYVLDNFLEKETKVVTEVLGIYEQMVNCFLQEGIHKAMSLYNKKHI